MCQARKWPMGRDVVMAPGGLVAPGDGKAWDIFSAASPSWLPVAGWDPGPDTPHRIFVERLPRRHVQGEHNSGSSRSRRAVRARPPVIRAVMVHQPCLPAASTTGPQTLVTGVEGAWRLEMGLFPHAFEMIAAARSGPCPDSIPPLMCAWGGRARLHGPTG